MPSFIKFLIAISLTLFAACGNPAASDKLLVPPSDVPSQSGTTKYETSHPDSLQKLQKDSFDHSKQASLSNEAHSTKNVLTGLWRWDKSICCGRMAKVILDTSKEKLTLKFEDNDIVNYYRGTRLVDTKVYRLGRVADHAAIRLEGNPHAAFLSVEADTLIINYAYMDLQTDYYIRVKE